MFHIKTYNKIDSEGLAQFDKAKFSISESVKSPDAILVRSHDLRSLGATEPLLAIGRAGAGVNNIDVSACTNAGVVVFNTPGANANAVKELVLGSIILVSRGMFYGIQHLTKMDATAPDFVENVEILKSNYKGTEIANKRLGVIGLGAIGTMVANDASNLGMMVDGYDPFISVDRAWGLSRNVRQAKDLRTLLSSVDYISLHVPLTENTASFFNLDKIKKLKKGITILNFSRGEIVNLKDILWGLDNGYIRKYVTDFPTKELLNHPNVITFPHLGASTFEAEKNCAVMIARQVQEYLLHGNIQNSVNFPDCYLDQRADKRMVVLNKNVPNMVGQMTSILAEKKVNIVEMLNKSKEEIAYTVVDFNGKYPKSLLNEIISIEGVIRARLL